MTVKFVLLFTPAPPGSCPVFVMIVKFALCAMTPEPSPVVNVVAVAPPASTGTEPSTVWTGGPASGEMPPSSPDVIGDEPAELRQPKPASDAAMTTRAASLSIRVAAKPSVRFARDKAESARHCGVKSIGMLKAPAAANRVP